MSAGQAARTAVTDFTFPAAWPPSQAVACQALFEQIGDTFQVGQALVRRVGLDPLRAAKGSTAGSS